MLQNVYVACQQTIQIKTLAAENNRTRGLQKIVEWFPMCGGFLKTWVLLRNSWHRGYTTTTDPLCVLSNCIPPPNRVVSTKYVQSVVSCLVLQYMEQFSWSFIGQNHFRLLFQHCVTSQNARAFSKKASHWFCHSSLFLRLFDRIKYQYEI